MADRRTYPSPEEITVVVRAAHERTEELCVRTVVKQLPSSNQLTVLHERPFSKAVQRTLEIGIEAKRPWLIAIDADIIPLDDVVARIREICGKMADHAFVATPLFLCHMVGGFATRGLHCYRASLLPRAYALLGGIESGYRPESNIHDAMVHRGYTRECYAKICGLHEYQQSALHIYLKAMLRYRKDEYREQIRASLIARASGCRDCQIALWGFDDAAHDTRTESADGYEYAWDAEYERFRTRMNERGWSDKKPLECESMTGYALRVIRAHNYYHDQNTLPWIRDLLRFEQGGSDALEYVNTTPEIPSGACCVDHS